MKKIIVLAVFLCFAVTLAYAQPAGQPSQEVNKEMTLKGVIVDNACAGAQKPEQLAEFVKTHTKQCALMPQCEASGYSIFTDGKLIKFDKASSAKIAEFLKKEGSKLQVVVVAKKAGEELSLISLANQ
ncbi:MAG: hypothetical protein PHN57_01605 [Candidatus Omnitrophica bacterium]|nr:hypothetical protein [Candidatus Omnitrophota bacterium]